VPERPPYRGLELALQVIGYEWFARSAEDGPLDPIAALEAVRLKVDAFPGVEAASPLSATYPRLVELAAASLVALAAMPHPDEVDGLRGYEGFTLWQQSRQPGT
jgi:hypothetical protein